MDKDDDDDDERTPAYGKEYKTLLRHFLAKAKQGIVMSQKDLRAYCSRKKISVKPKMLRELRFHFKWTAVHSRAVKPSGFMAQTIPKYGSYFVDFAEFKPRLKRFNGGHVGFLVFVEGITNKTFVIPVKNKSADSWERAIYQLLEEHEGEVRNLVSDRDSAVSKRFREKIKRDLDITWFFLYNRSKSFRAETMISYLKTRLSVAMKTKGTNRWTDLTEGIANDYNSRPIGKTKIIRNSVDKTNYMDFLAQKWGTKSPGATINTLSASNFSPRMAKLLFRYALGQKVLLRADSDYSSRIKKFKKKSTEGSYLTEVFTVVARKLKTSHNAFHTTVYRIEGETSGELKPFFYESDLVPAKFAES